MTGYRHVHVVAEDATGRRGGQALIWAYGPAEARRVLFTAASVAWSQCGYVMRCPPRAVVADWVKDGALPVPLGLACAPLRLLGRMSLADVLEQCLGHAAAPPVLQVRRLAGAAGIEDGGPCTGWGARHLAALSGQPLVQATRMAKRHRTCSWR